MTQEDKKLLLKDLCARLPYKLVCEAQFKEYGEYKTSIMFLDGVFNDDAYFFTKKVGSVYSNDYKPYLFPLSSMTEEQQEEFDRIYADDMQVVANNLKNRLDGKPYETNLGHYRHIDWLNAYHFDYRRLIEKSLALDATNLGIYE